MIAFKLKLTNPLTDTIPSYLLAQKDQLEDYAKTVLLEKSGFIRTHLESSKQVNAFVSHLISYVEQNGTTRSTRRACLVVPHEPLSSDEPKPLGLISIWAKPRFESDGKRFMDFVFVWRTVEAFIGLPYSLYGSIQFARQLLDTIAAGLDPAESATAPILGELTYIALSLHLGSDDFHMRVAKRIVDAASD